jgi:sugar (pentulose or hexulose) kinase
MIAAVVAGLAPDLPALAGRVPPPSAVFAPDPAASPAADEAYRRYQRLVSQLEPLSTARWLGPP